MVLAWVALAAYCGLYIGLFSFLLSSVFSTRSKQDGVSRAVLLFRSMMLVLLAPILWVGCEYLRAILFTGFPWNPLGVSQYRNIAVIQLAAWGGVYAVSGIVVLLNAAIAMTILRIATEMRSRERRRRIHFELMIGLALVAICWSQGVRTIRRADARPADTQPIRIAAVQPQIRQVRKWSDDQRSSIYRALQEQSELAAMSRPDLIVWPETAIPDLIRIDAAAQDIVSSLLTNGTMLLVGGMDFEEWDESVAYYNASFLMAESGGIVGCYRKRHLVPFGEYVPFENHIALVKRLVPLGFSCTPGEGSELMTLPSRNTTSRGALPFGVLICFEDIFPYLARHDVRRGARFLVNQTNDAWFEDSAASQQHMANAVFRAIENRVALVRCANTGVTCFVDPFGRILEMLIGDDGRTDMRGFAVAEVHVAEAGPPRTPYTRFGDWLFARPCAMVSTVLLLMVWMKSLRWRLGKVASQRPHCV